MPRREEPLLMPEPTLDVLHKSSLTRYQLRHKEDAYYICMEDTHKPVTLIARADDHVLLEICGQREEFIIIGEINE